MVSKFQSLRNAFVIFPPFGSCGAIFQPLGVRTYLNPNPTSQRGTARQLCGSTIDRELKLQVVVVELVVGVILARHLGAQVVDNV